MYVYYIYIYIYIYIYPDPKLHHLIVNEKKKC